MKRVINEEMIELGLLLSDDSLFNCEHILFFEDGEFLQGDRINKLALQRSLLNLHLSVEDAILDDFIERIGDRRFGLMRLTDSDNWLFIAYDEVMRIVDFTSTIPTTLYYADIKL